MPKSKPTQVIVHRIELQDSEREMMQTLVNAKSLESVGKGAYHLGIVMVGGVAVYVVWWTLDSMYGWLGKAGEWWDVTKARMKEPVTLDTFKKDPDRKGYSKDGTPLNLFGLPGWGVIPGWL